MLPFHKLRRIVSEIGHDFPGLGLFHNGNVSVVRRADDPAAGVIEELLTTRIAKNIRERLRSIPATPGTHEVVLPLGIAASYLSLDHITECSAGIFVIRSIPVNSQIPIQDILSKQRLSRKEKKRLLMIVASQEGWSHPREGDFPDLFSRISEAAIQEYESHNDEAFSNTLTSYKDFVSSFSHEALSPIQEIRTSLELTITKSALDSSTRERLDSSLQALDNLRVSLEGMRLLFRDDEKRPLPNQFRMTNIRSIIRHWCDFYRTQFETKNIEVILEPMAQPWNVWCVPEYIEVMVRNLVSNGLKYSFDASGYDEPGKFLVRFEPSSCLLTFVNFGVPIQAEELRSGQLFRQGQRGYTADDRGRVGKGVGLFLVARIVDLHDAVCKVTSEIKNPGGVQEFARTEFAITFQKRQRHK